MRTVDLSIKLRTRINYSPYIDEVVSTMGEHSKIPKGEVLEAAILLFYRNVFCAEKRMLADMGLMLDSATLQNQELAMESSALESLAELAMQEEGCPLFPQPEEEGT